jgi:mannose-6-phosphate isomerase
MYPGNGGVLVALLMHHVRLSPGQALFLGAGNAHAYLSGSGVEVMSSSDNVVRAAFTKKYVSVDEFLAVAHLAAIPSPVVNAIEASPGRFSYPVSTSRFGVERIEVAGETTIKATHQAEILVCTAGDATSIHRGQACVLRNNESIHLTGSATVFRTWGTH